MAWRGIEAGVYLPSLGSQCVSFCGVRDYCSAFGGVQSHRVPPFETAFYATKGDESVS
jgi:hypothetical protein